MSKMKEPHQPHYAMLQDAMLHLKQRKGASLAQIRKHLEANYEEKLDTTNKKLLTSALKGLVQTGKIKKTGGVYKLSSSGSGDEIEPGARGRRRLPAGWCKTHKRYHKVGKRRKRRRRRRRTRRRRRRTRRRRRRTRRRRKSRRRRRRKAGWWKTHHRQHPRRRKWSFTHSKRRKVRRRSRRRHMGRRHSRRTYSHGRSRGISQTIPVGGTTPNRSPAPSK